MFIFVLVPKSIYPLSSSIPIPTLTSIIIRYTYFECIPHLFCSQSLFLFDLYIQCTHYSFIPHHHLFLIVSSRSQTQARKPFEFWSPASAHVIAFVDNSLYVCLGLRHGGPRNPSFTYEPFRAHTSSPTLSQEYARCFSSSFFRHLVVVKSSSATCNSRHPPQEFFRWNRPSRTFSSGQPSRLLPFVPSTRTNEGEDQLNAESSPFIRRT